MMALTMADNLKPRDAKEVEQAVQWALGNGKTFEVVGRGSKRAIGRAAQWDATLDLSALSGVTLYEPEELVLSAKAGTPIAEIEALVASRNQQLAFEPMDYAVLLGGAAGVGTIGGTIAANLSGPRRIKAGAARDHFLGFSAVSGRGETFKSGGRVVKNVTGYDLCKLLAGSWGTLAAMTDITIKTCPKPRPKQRSWSSISAMRSQTRSSRRQWLRSPMYRAPRICRHLSRRESPKSHHRKLRWRRFALKGWRLRWRSAKMSWRICSRRSDR